MLEIDAFHLWYVEPGDVKKALDGGEIMCCFVHAGGVSVCLDVECVVIPWLQEEYAVGPHIWLSCFDVCW